MADAAKEREQTVYDFVCEKHGFGDIKLDGKAGIVHRLDKGTSGLMVVALNQAAKENMMKQFENRSVEKEYLAICSNKSNSSSKTDQHSRHVIIETLDNNWVSVSSEIIKTQARGGCWSKRVAIGQSNLEFCKKIGTTLYKTIDSSNTGKKRFFLTLCKPITGYTHQIRLHSNLLDMFVVGDLAYGSKMATNPRPRRLMLHARKFKIFASCNRIFALILYSSPSRPFILPIFRRSKYIANSIKMRKIRKRFDFYKVDHDCNL